jgi:vitamin B12 transporter
MAGKAGLTVDLATISRKRLPGNTIPGVQTKEAHCVIAVSDKHARRFRLCKCRAPVFAQSAIRMDSAARCADARPFRFLFAGLAETLFRPMEKHNPMSFCSSRFIMALLIVFAFPVNAAEQELDPLIVTATRQPARASELLSDITVVDREEIERSAQESIADLLSKQSGIQQTTSGGPGTETSFYVRGARPEQTKILVDGISMNSMDLSGSPLRFLPLAGIERIEILRGPASTLYGADAIGGVIQIFTRRGEPGLRMNAFAGYGTRNTLKNALALSGGNEQWRFWVEGNHASSDSVSARKHATQRDADKDSYRNGGAAASLSFLPAKGHELGLSYRQNEGLTRFDSSNQPANGNFDNRTRFKIAQWSIYSRNKILDAWTSRFQYGESEDIQRTFDTWLPGGALLNTVNRQLGWQNDIRLPALGKALFAYEYQEQHASPRRDYSQAPKISTTSFLAGWSGHYGAHRWQASARGDNNSRFGQKTTHSLAYGYQLTKTLRAYTSYGTAFKAPSVYQLFVPNYGNINLKPETARNTEAAIFWEKGAHTTSVTLYRNRLDNLIEYSFVANRYMNISKARLEGMTLAYTGHIGDWSMRAAYDWLNAVNEDTRKRLGRRTRNSVSLTAGRRWGAVSAAIELITSGRRFNDNSETKATEMGGYTLINLTSRYAINRNFSLEARLNNLFDKKHETVYGYNTLGFNAFAGFRYSPQ